MLEKMLENILEIVYWYSLCIILSILWGFLWGDKLYWYRRKREISKILEQILIYNKKYGNLYISEFKFKSLYNIDQLNYIEKDKKNEKK